MIRSEIKRKAPMARTTSIAKAPKPPKGPRKRKCKVCRSEFEPRNMTHVACGFECAQAHGVAVAAKQKAKSQRQDRAIDKAKKDSLKTYPILIRETQIAFNSMIRFRDRLAGFACISSGRPLDWSGNAVDAGHYRSRGSAPHLRFNEDNCHAQSKQDNRYGSGEAVAYRIGLIARIGLDRVEALESNNTVRKWTHDELRAMKADYQRRVREMKRYCNGNDCTS